MSLYTSQNNKVLNEHVGCTIFDLILKKGLRNISEWTIINLSEKLCEMECLIATHSHSLGTL